MLRTKPFDSILRCRRVDSIVCCRRKTSRHASPVGFGQLRPASQNFFDPKLHRCEVVRTARGSAHNASNSVDAITEGAFTNHTSGTGTVFCCPFLSRSRMNTRVSCTDPGLWHLGRSRGRSTKVVADEGFDFLALRDFLSRKMM